MNIVSRPTLINCWKNYPDSEGQLETWYKAIKRKKWKSLNELKESFPNASILKDNRMKFKIKGNTYRLIVKFNLARQMCFVRWFGTHAEYDKIDANTI